MSKKLKIGLLGAGRIGKLHGNNISYHIPNAKIVAMADPMLNDDMKAWANELGFEAYDDPEKIFSNPDIDAVFICSSTDTHADFIIKAAQAGKHIFCEKPIHTDISRIKEAIDAAKKAKVKLQIGFVRRFDHNHKKVHDIIASGKLGEPNVVKVTSRDPDHPPVGYIKDSGGMFFDMTIHDFDMAGYLAGSEITEVMAYGACLSDIADEYKKYDDVDTATIMLKFKNGALGIIDNSRASIYGYDQRTEVQCLKGCVQVSNDLENTAMISTAEGVEVAKPTWFFLERYNDAFVAETKDFVEAVLNDTEVPVGGEAGLISVVVAKAAAKSLKEGRPVKLSEIEQ